MLRISQPRIISFVGLLGKPGITPALSGIACQAIARGILLRRPINVFGPAGEAASFPPQFYGLVFSLFTMGTVPLNQSLQWPGPMVPSL
jgi:hypothetical protein